MSGPFADWPPFQTGSDTSELAAESVAPEASTMRAKVLAAIVACGEFGATDDELERHLHMRHQTASARRRELVLTAKIVKTQTRRKTSSGRSAAVYVAVAEPARLAAAS